MQVEVDVKCMQTNFGGHGPFSFGDSAPFCFPSKTAKISLQTMGYSPWGSKNRIGSKYSCKLRLMKYACKPILVGVTTLVSEMLLQFVFLQKLPNFPFKPWTIVHGGQKIELAQNFHASRGWREMLANQFWWAWLPQFRRNESFLFAFKNGQNFPFKPWTMSTGSKNRIGSKFSCKLRLMKYACKPISVGMTTLVPEILLLFVCVLNQLYNPLWWATLPQLANTEDNIRSDVKAEGFWCRQ